MSFFPTQELKITLSASQILSLNSSPVLLIPGKTGCLVEIQSLYFRYVHGTVPFNPVSMDAILVYFGPAVSNNPALSLFTLAQGFVDQATDMSVWQSPTWGGNGNGNIPFHLSAYIGQGVSINQYNGSVIFPTGSNWTLGNGSLVVFAKYSYIEVS